MVLLQFQDVQMTPRVTLMQMLQKMMDHVVMQKKIMIVMVTVQQMLTVMMYVVEPVVAGSDG